MATKTITITEDAYSAVRRLKGDEESFSELFLRMSSKKLRINDILGVLKDSQEDVARFREDVQKSRAMASQGTDWRLADVRSRLKRTH